MNPKNTTLLEKFGFKDIDLTSPKHDEIMIKLLDKPTLINVIISKYFKDSKVNIQRVCRNYYKSYNSDITCNEEKGHICPFFYKNWREIIPNCPQHKIAIEELDKIDIMTLADTVNKHLFKVEPEYVVKTESGFIIGYIDIKASFYANEIPEWKILQPNFTSNDNIKITPEARFENNDKLNFYIEIKTSITSFGETLRQINTYKSVCPGNYLLVTPKTPFKDAFEQNGVQVYEI